MKSEVGAGLCGMAIGLTLMLGGNDVCRKACWLTGIVRGMLPPSMESLAGGLPWFLGGLGLIAYAVASRRE